MGVLKAVGGIFKGIWRALDGVRKVLHLILLLALFGIFLAATRSTLPYVPSEAALVLAPEGRIVEELSGDALDRALYDLAGERQPETRLEDVLEVIRAAADDDRVRALVLDLGALERAGLPALQEIGGAIADFRQSGKKVLAWGAYYDQRHYYLAAQADEVYVDPFGAVIIEGYAYFRQYLKGTADKLGVEVNVFKVGTHKSAPDNLTRSSMSEEDRSEAQVWIGALWEAWKRDVAAAREIEPQALQAYADHAGAGVRQAEGDLAQYALGRGLVDGLKTREQFDERVSEEVGLDEDEYSFQGVHWRQYLAVLQSEHALRKRSKHNVGVVVAAGDIFDGVQPPGTVGGDTLSELLRQARHDERIEAVVLRIDSPGGSMFAAEQVRREVAALRAAGKPVVASMASVAASGGYYIAAPADRIFAAPTTVTGSIGVYAVLPTFGRTLGKIGITTDGFGTTALAGAGRIDRDLNPQLAEVLQASVGHAYRTFVSGVAQARQRPYEDIDSIGQGRVWSGADARNVGLVDEFGGLSAAVEEAARLGGLPDGYGVEWLEQGRSWRDMLVFNLRATAARFVRWAGFDVRRPALPLLELVAPEAASLLRLTESGRPLYWCACRVE